MSSSPGPDDAQWRALLARLKAMREKSRSVQQELAELEEQVRRYRRDQAGVPHPPAPEDGYPSHAGVSFKAV